MAGKAHRRASDTGGAASGASKAAGGGGVGNAERAARIAASATSGGGGAVPHLDAVQTAFGHHDLSNVSAHFGGQASEAASSLNAEAFAYGSDIVFAGSPSLHLVAHEATHVVQQGAGNGPSSGMGQEGDSYESFADQVADQVVAGQSVEAMLDKVASPGLISVSQPAVQQRNLGRKEVSQKAMGRITNAQAGIDHTKSVLSHGAGNQLEALKASNFNSYFRMAAMRDRDAWQIDPGVYDLCRSHPEALTAAKADLAQGGNCGEHAAIAFDWLRTNTSNIVHKSAKEGLDHAFVVIGDAEKDADDELVVCDPWPTAPTACLWEDHFAFTSDRDQLKLHSTATGDGRDVKAAIAAGLSLSAKGMAMIRNSLSEERTAEEIKKGTSDGEKPWIWQHADAASSKYTYDTAKPAVEPTSGSTDTGAGTDGQMGSSVTPEERSYLDWLRQWSEG